MNNHIFISYKSEERPVARQIQQLLNSLGYQTWLDDDNLSSKEGFTWQHEIDYALRSARAVVAIVTPRAMSSRYVTNEWDIAIVNRIPFIPLLYRPTAMLPRFANLTNIDVRDAENPEAAKKIDEAVQLALQKSVTHDVYDSYLSGLFERVSGGIGRLMIQTLTTYGQRGNVHGEPIALNCMVDDSTFENVADAFDRCQNRAVILGTPGAGKTISLMNYARDAIIHRVQNPDAPLPIIANIATWDPERHEKISDWLAVETNSLQNLSHLLKQGQLLLLLDGLDELGQSRLSERDEKSYDPRLLFLKQLPTNNRLLLTCRLEQYGEIIESSPVEKTIILQPLDDDKIAIYLRDQREVKDALQDDSQLRELLRTPLLLSLFAFIYENMTAEERQAFEKLASANDARDIIFQEYFKRRYFHETEKFDSIPIKLEAIYQALGRLTMKQIETHDWLVIPLFFDDFTKFLPERDALDIIDIALRMQILLPTSKFNFKSTAEWLAAFRADSERPLRSAFLYSERSFLAFFIHRLIKEHIASHYVTKLFQLPAITNSDRLKIGLALYHLGDERGVELLIAALGHYERYEEDNSMGERQAEDAWEVFQIMAGNYNMRLFWRISEISERFLIASGTYAVPSMIEKLRDEHFSAAYRLPRILGKIGDNRALYPLLDCLENHRSAEMLFFTARGLGYLEDATAIPALLDLAERGIGLQLPKYLVEEAISDYERSLNYVYPEEYYTVEYSALRAVRDILSIYDTLHKDVSHLQITTQLSNHISSPNPEVRYFTVEALGILRNREGSEKLVEVIEKDTVLKVQFCAAWGLGLIADPRVAGHLMSILNQNPPPEIKYMLVRALGAMKWEEAVDTIIPLLGEPINLGFQPLESEKREPATMEAAVERTIHFLKEYPADLDEMAAEALTMIGTPKAIQAVHNWQSSKNQKK